MRKQSFKIESYINKDICIGDVVKLFDGSALSLNYDKHKVDEHTFAIVYTYPEFGFSRPLKDYIWTVKEIGITDVCCEGVLNIMYLQDIIVECNGYQFRTSSGMVKSYK